MNNAIKQAEAFCKKHNIQSYPVDILKICKDLDIVVYSQNLEQGVSGLILISKDDIREYDNFKKVIVVNDKDSNARKRFTIAHELGHYILHKTDEMDYYAHRENNADMYSSEEIDANSFASEILMPTNLVNDILENYGLKETGISDEMISCISREFFVSQAAAEVRLKKLNLI